MTMCLFCKVVTGGILDVLTSFFFEYENLEEVACSSHPFQDCLWLRLLSAVFWGAFNLLKFGCGLQGGWVESW